MVNEGRDSIARILRSRRFWPGNVLSLSDRITARRVGRTTGQLLLLAALVTALWDFISWARSSTFTSGELAHQLFRLNRWVLQPVMAGDWGSLIVVLFSWPTWMVLGACGLALVVLLRPRGRTHDKPTGGSGSPGWDKRPEPPR